MSETNLTTIGGDRGVRPRVFDALTKVAGLKSAHFAFRIWDMLKFLMNGTPRNAVGSIDITYRCNLKCKHCYFMEQGYDSELTDEQWVSKMDYWRDHTDFPFYQCSWVGGEPLMRKKLVEKLMPRFRSNLVATNGSIPLPDWCDCNFYVSVDGTREYYQTMRGKEDLYDRIKDNVNSSPHLKITAGMTVNKDNWRCIPELLEEWNQTHIKGFLFQFYTPIRGLDNDMWPGWKLRDHVIDMIIQLKRRYGDFIHNEIPTLRLMKSKVAPKVTRNCPFSQVAFALGPDGKVKPPCMMGEKADCSRCGCVLPFHTWLLNNSNMIIRELMRTIRMMVHNRKLPRMRQEAIRRARERTEQPERHAPAANT